MPDQIPAHGVDMEVQYTILPLALELLSTVKFSQRLYPLANLPHSRGRPHNHKNLGLKKMIIRAKKHETVLGG